MTNKRLNRSNDNMFLGVAAGIADYVGIDVTLIRLLFVLFTLAGGPGLIAYILLAIVMPKHGTRRSASSVEEEIIIEKDAASA